MRANAKRSRICCAHPGYEVNCPSTALGTNAMTIADVRTSKRTAKSAPNQSSSKQDLRAWLELLREHGEVQEITGAEREKEIGGIVDLYMRKMGNPAVLFDDIPGYPHGH